MTFETVGPERAGGLPSRGRGAPAGRRGTVVRRASRAVAGRCGSSSRLTNAPGGVGSEGGAAGTVGNAAGTVPLQKPKETSALVQFTLSSGPARVRRRHTQGVRGAEAVGVRDGVPPVPVVIRMPASEARRFAGGG